MATDASTTDFPLAGIKVADFSRVLAGPLATMTLADLGADVVKVERPGIGDDTRHWGPPWTKHSSSYFECANRSKRSIALDLKDPDDVARARELALDADVVVENFKAGTMDRLGLGHDDLSAAHPGLVYCSITGFGSAAGADLPGYDFLVQAVGGLMSITGDADGEPTKVGVALVDVLTGKDAVIGILAALHERDRSGRGQRVEVALLTSLLGSLANQASAYLATGINPGRMGNQHPSITPYETLRCRDGHIAVACGNDAQFARLATALGHSSWSTDPRFATNEQRVAHRMELIEALEGALTQQDADVWLKRLRVAGVAAGRVGDIGSAIALAEDLGLEPTVDLGPEHPRGIRHPVTFSRSSLRPATPPPELPER
ncbi:CaiB/BaiF CoA-transferase family protein [Yimella sp. cx-51]|uniref:CaiB/BaiF CoA transferase family protein n=1 Tax=Yimella sp. cx-51 TaxID=2770551 RepID=UPI00165E3A5F|nr:CoA transferase [Yimella sp. cx-51]MBC9956203.1 CoA transferase [Yimella sp. cx-51]MBD2760853.1 CoA transferase [Yimella sp. cx-573]QTH38647.1 CoA transferase [Yimella sp. cx-51]